MLICVDCGTLFEQAKVVFEHHGLDTPPYEEMHVCPCCEGGNIHHAHRCDVCGEWITGGYVLTLEKERICDDCYSIRDAEDD